MNTEFNSSSGTTLPAKQPPPKVGISKDTVGEISAGPAFRIHDILLPTDFSEHSNAALKYGLQLAQQLGARITLLHVFEPPPMSLEAGVTYPSDELLERLRKDAKRVLVQVCEQGQLEFPILRQVIVEVGVPQETINRTAKEQEMDLIILCTHGRSGLAHVLLGSIAEKVVREAPCPVLVVRAEHRTVAGTDHH